MLIDRNTKRHLVKHYTTRPSFSLKYLIKEYITIFREESGLW